MLARGAELLEARFPGPRAELAALGAPVYDWGPADLVVEATSSDLSWDPAPPSRSARLIRWYFHHLLDLIPTDPEVATRFFRVQNMISNPTALAAPRMIAKVLHQSGAARAPHEGAS